VRVLVAVDDAKVIALISDVGYGATLVPDDPVAPVKITPTQPTLCILTAPYSTYIIGGCVCACVRH
jgi:hypothetical protein